MADEEIVSRPNSVEIKEQIGPVEEPGTRSVIARIRENTRAIVVYLLIFSVLLVYIIPWFCSSVPDNYWNLTDKLLTALIALLGTAIGFYFRSKE
jgi:hypothetical protein